MKFIISETDEILVSHSGLALAGSLVRWTAIQKRINRIRLGDRKRPEVPHGDVAAAMIGLLCLGKPDFEAIEAFREDEFFRRALGLAKVPSEGTLRQRLEQLADACEKILREESAAMIARHAPKLTPCYEDWVALDADVSPWDNSGTKKEGVSWTYKDVDGFAPVFAYLGEEGYLIHCQLRRGSQHCQEGMPDFLDEAIDYARRITPAKLLVRIRKPVARRRLASVIQDLMYLAARLTHTVAPLYRSLFTHVPTYGGISGNAQFPLTSMVPEPQLPIVFR